MNNIKKNKIKNIDTIVFGGASAYGYSYFGVYDKLLELGFNFKRVAGVSAGSIFSSNHPQETPTSISGGGMRY